MPAPTPRRRPLLPRAATLVASAPLVLTAQPPAHAAPVSPASPADGGAARGTRYGYSVRDFQAFAA
ncbi:hypothetical protein PUR61_23005 [Streptomyces sp. BE20]|uniref:hypothetical protein n=1 Tax=Streptomyces sp. BE20 TaxID=3002525 RepID=UPI002E79605C|nr:hypothetical protein [Streptomyces sp. BE20]MEE1825027.1 hypothetical protein [Streptomyces sp. BE20]